MLTDNITCLLRRSYLVSLSKMWRLAVIAAVLTLNVCAVGKASSVAAFRYKGQVCVDGRLDETAWKDAPSHSIRHSLSEEKPPVDTSFKVLYDEDSVYFGVVCQQPDISNLRAKCKNRDGGVWSDDSIELFIDPGGKGGPYFQFVINSIGTIFDARYQSGRAPVPGWNALGIKAVTQISTDSWTIELRIPFDDLLGQYAATEPSVSANTWRFNLGRNYRGGRALTHQSYCKVSNYFDTTRYARLDGINIDYDRFRWRIGPVTLLRVKPRDTCYRVEMSVAVWNESTKFRPFRLKAEVELPDGKRTKLVIAKTFGANAGQMQILPFGLNVPAGGSVALTMLLNALPSGERTAWRRFRVPVDVTPLTVSVAHPFYRSAIYADMNVDAVRLAVGAKWTPKWTANDRLRLRVVDASGKNLVSRELTDPRVFIGEHALKIPDLAPGQYNCVADILRNGKKLYVAETPLHVYPPSPSLVRVNEWKNIVINGKETFLVGAFHAAWLRDFGRNCNAAITYGVAADLTKNPADGEYLEKYGRQGRWATRFPYPKSIWPHLVGGRPELATKLLRPDHARMITERTAQYKHVQGLLGWYLADEPSPHRCLPDYIKGVADAVRKSDPYHPCLISFNNGHTVVNYADAIELVSVHWYCMFTDQGPQFPLSTVAEHVEAARKGVNDRKPVIVAPLLWMYAHGGNVRMPTHDETRCMAYLGIVHGARGVIWYSTAGFTCGLEPRIGTPVLVDELRMMSPVFLSHEEVKLEVSGPDTKAVHTMGKVLDGQLYVIAVNAEPREANVSLTLPKRWARSASLREIDSDAPDQVVSNGRTALRFLPYEVRIFTVHSKATKVVTRQELRRRFAKKHRELLESGNLCYRGRGATVKTSKEYGDVGRARLQIDGYKELSDLTARDMKKGSWIEVRFPTEETVGRIEVSSTAETDRPRAPSRLKKYTLELLTHKGWVTVNGKVAEEVSKTVFTRVHRFPAMQALALRLTMQGDGRRVGFPTEIQAFGAER